MCHVTIIIPLLVQVEDDEDVDMESSADNKVDTKEKDVGILILSDLFSNRYSPAPGPRGVPECERVGPGDGGGRDGGHQQRGECAASSPLSHCLHSIYTLSTQGEVLGVWPAAPLRLEPRAAPPPAPPAPTK